MSELKPCPFCGETNLMKQSMGEFKWQHCETCSGYGPWVHWEEDEILAWNTRPIENVLSQRITDLEDMLIDMVEQYCQYSYKPGTEDVDKYSHDFMSTGEYVFAYLVEHGLAEWTDERKAFITMKARKK